MPLAKYLVAKRAPSVVAEAMECLGGAGYVEESPLPRLFRQSPLNAIWEGSGNVIALDVVRALGREPEVREAFLHELREAARGDRRFSSVVNEVEALLASPVNEARARRLAERLALALGGAALIHHAPHVVADAFLARRLGGASLTFGAGDGAIDMDALIARVELNA